MNSDTCWECGVESNSLNADNLCRSCKGHKEWEEKEGEKDRREKEAEQARQEQEWDRNAREYECELAEKRREDEQDRKDWIEIYAMDIEIEKDKKKRAERDLIEKQTDRWNKKRLGLLPLGICTQCNQEIYVDDLSKQEKREIYRGSPCLDNKIYCPGCRKDMLDGSIPLGKCHLCSRDCYHESFVRDNHDENKLYCNLRCLLCRYDRLLKSRKALEQEASSLAKEKKEEFQKRERRFMKNAPDKILDKGLQTIKIKRMAKRRAERVDFWQGFKGNVFESYIERVDVEITPSERRTMIKEIRKQEKGENPDYEFITQELYKRITPEKGEVVIERKFGPDIKGISVKMAMEKVMMKERNRLAEIIVGKNTQDEFLAAETELYFVSLRREAAENVRNNVHKEYRRKNEEIKEKKLTKNMEGS